MRTELHGIAEAFLVNGYYILRNVIFPDEAKKLGQSVLRTVAQNSKTPAPKGYLGGFIKHNVDVVEYLNNSQILDVCVELLGDHFRCSMVTGLVNGPGLRRGGLHRDWPHNPKDNTYLPAHILQKPAHLVTLWMLSDFTVDNGGTIVLPGSHKWTCDQTKFGRVACSPEGVEIQLLGRAGDVILLDARTWHAIAANTTDMNRVALVARYAPWWLNLNPLKLGTLDRHFIIDSIQGIDPVVAALPLVVYELLPDMAKRWSYSLM